jgi:hypothetical protein
MPISPTTSPVLASPIVCRHPLQRTYKFLNTPEKANSEKKKKSEDFYDYTCLFCIILFHDEFLRERQGDFNEKVNQSRNKRKRKKWSVSRGIITLFIKF